MSVKTIRSYISICNCVKTKVCHLWPFCKRNSKHCFSQGKISWFVVIQKRKIINYRTQSGIYKRTWRFKNLVWEKSRESVRFSFYVRQVMFHLSFASFQTTGVHKQLQSSKQTGIDKTKQWLLCFDNYQCLAFQLT